MDRNATRLRSAGVTYMKPNLTNNLCMRYGLCCDGSLFADVELAGPVEAMVLEASGLEIEDDDTGAGLLVQPCVALRERKCGIYAQRPECCRTFECRLLQDLRSGTVDLQRAKDHVAEALKQAGRVRNLMAELGQHDTRLPLKERYIEALALADEAGASAIENQKHLRLEAEMTTVETMIQRYFL